MTTSKSCFGLGQSQVRLYTALARRTVLVMAALAICARLLACPPPPGAAGRWPDWRRRHQALSAWYHQRTRLTRNAKIAPAS